MWIGIDVGGTTIKGGLVSDKGEIVARLQQKTAVKEGYETVMDQISEMVNQLKNSDSSIEPVYAVGIGAPGTTSPQGDVYFANNLGWEGLPFQKDMANRLGIPVFVENDATMAAMGEYACGSLQSVKNGILLTLGTGVGSGLIINGKPYSGSHGLGRQAGHMIVGKNFYTCTCGTNGCLETFASATALVRYYEKRKKDCEKTEPAERESDIDARKVMKMAASGNKLAQESVCRLIYYLSIGVANLINILDPEIIALGGGLAKAGDQLFEPLHRELKKKVYDSDRLFTSVVPAVLGNDAGLVGSGMFARLKVSKHDKQF